MQSYKHKKLGGMIGHSKSGMTGNSRSGMTGIEIIVVIGVAALLFPKVKGWTDLRKADKVEKRQEQVLEAKVELADGKLDVVKDAQLDVRSTGIALDNGAVQLAKDFNDKADSKLGVAVGPITPKEDKELKLLIAGLTSEVESIRKQAEANLAKKDKASDKLVDRITELETQLNKAETKLDTATTELVEKSRELAAMAQYWYYTVALAVILALGWIYQKVTGVRALDAVYAKTAETITSLQTKFVKDANKEQDDPVIAEFDKAFDTKDKAVIRKHRVLK